MYVCIPGGCYDILHWNIAAVVSVGDISPDTTVKEYELLGHYAYLGAQPLDVVVPYVSAI